MGTRWASERPGPARGKETRQPARHPSPLPAGGLAEAPGVTAVTRAEITGLHFLAEKTQAGSESSPHGELRELHTHCITANKERLALPGRHSSQHCSLIRKGLIKCSVVKGSEQ